MNNESEPLDQNYSPDRVFYAFGRMLSVQDFDDEQTYHRGRLARAMAYLEGSGTVAGLKVLYQGPVGPDEEIEVTAGMAVDRLGRIIEVPRQACIRLDRWFKAQQPGDLVQGFHVAAGGVIADVFIRFVPCERGNTPAFASGPFDATDATSPSRIRDGYQLDLVIRKEGTPGLPQNPWPDLASIPAIADRRAALHNAIFAGWHEGTDARDENGHLKPLPEHADGQDTLSLFLARVVIPAAAATGGAPPVRSGPLTGKNIDNESRTFLYTPLALGRWIGI
ncbi:MAG TPA: hypothetical protein VKM56_04110 [Verrucomicrobiae bacterium]|nr:hypothetical protein [Verrucomicrobiae bacterium]